MPLVAGRPVTCQERFVSRRGRRGRDGRAELLYVIKNAADDTEAFNALEAAAPTVHRGMTRKDVDVEELGGGWYDGISLYEDPDQEVFDVGQSRFAFNLAGGIRHIKRSIRTVSATAATWGQTAGATGSVGPFDQAIGVTADGEITGCDIVAPVCEWEETHVLADSVVTPAYKGLLFRLTGTVNNATFKHLAKGENLFLGAAGSKTGSDRWEVTFRFAGSPNQTGVKIGNITVAEVEGWHYVWEYRPPTEHSDTNLKILAPKCKIVLVEQVYHYGNHAQIGIGTT